MNIIVFSGNLTKDADLRSTPSGKYVLNFSVANNQGFGDNAHTEYYECSLWGERAVKLEPHFKKGIKLVINGEHRTSRRESNGKEYFNNRIFVSDFEFASGSNGESCGASSSSPTQPAREPDDIPF